MTGYDVAFALALAATALGGCETTTDDAWTMPADDGSDPIADWFLQPPSEAETETALAAESGPVAAPALQSGPRRDGHAPRPAPVVAPDPELPPEPGAGLQALIDAVPGADHAFRLRGMNEVVHIQSGMRCRAPAIPGPVALVGVGLSPGVPAGEVVSCSYALGGGTLTLFAARDNGFSADAYLEQTAAALISRHPEARAEKPIVAAYPGIGKAVANSFSLLTDGRPTIVTSWAAVENGWLISAQASYPPAQREDLEVVGAMSLVSAQLSVAAGGR